MHYSIGLEHQVTHTIHLSDTIQHRVNSHLPDVLATFVLCEWMEVDTGHFIQQYLDLDHISLGRKFTINHLKAGYPGETLQICIAIGNCNRKIVSFKLEAQINGKIIATAQHTRVIVPLLALRRN